MKTVFSYLLFFIGVNCQLQHYLAYELQGASTDEQGGVPDVISQQVTLCEGFQNVNERTF